MSSPTIPYSAPAARSALVGQARGAAALAVLLFHTFGAEAGIAIWPPLEPIRAIADHGWLGVHVFFVLSGYCMGEKLSALHAAGRGAGGFLLDRAWRIYPAFWGAMIFAVALGLASAPFNRSGWSGALPASFATGLAEAALIHPYFGVSGLLLISWTLVCETGFYAVTAVLFRGWRAGMGFGGFLLIGAALSAVAVRVPSDPAWMVLRLWPEYWLGLLAYGATAFAWREPTRPRVLCIAGLSGASLLTLFAPPGSFVSFHLAAVCTAVALVGLHRWDGWIAANPATRWLGAVGVWSYSLYLVHAPLVSRWHNLAISFAPAESPRYALLWLVSLALGLAGGWIFYRAVEAPLERLRRDRFFRPAKISP